MNISVKGKSVHFDDRYLPVEPEEGRALLTPESCYKELQAGAFKQLTNYRFICQGTGMEWPELEYHINSESRLLSQIYQKAA